MPDSSFECPNCGKTLDTGSELQSHIEIEHTQVSSLTLCSKVSSEYVKNLVDETDNFESDYESYEEKKILSAVNVILLPIIKLTWTITKKKSTRFNNQ